MSDDAGSPNHQSLSQLAKSKHIEVLVVEDDSAEIRLAQEAFKAAGLTSDLHYVSDGDDALMYVRREGKYAGVPLPDLIFLDLILTEVPGLEVLKAIKSSPELRHIPIIVWSGLDDPRVVKAVYELSGNCFIRKPDNLTELLGYIEMCYQFWGGIVTLSPTSDNTSAW